MRSKNILIHSSDRRTWGEGAELLFLGKWCTPFEYKDDLNGLKYKYAEPYGLSNKQKEIDNDLILKIESEILRYICENLNAIHSKSYMVREWQIIIGHWLRRFINVVFNRVKTLETAFNNYEVDQIMFLIGGINRKIPINSAEAIDMFSNDYWNNDINKLLFEHFEFDKKFDVDVKVITLTNQTDKTDRKYTRSFKRKLLDVYQKVAYFLSRHDDYVLIDTYMPNYSCALLELSLLQIPKFNTTEPLILTTSENFLLRKELSDNALKIESDCLTKLIASLAFTYMPVSYLEGYDEIKLLDRPYKNVINPKCIFTSNCFDVDDVFKVWLADQVSNGCKYIAGQHGNNYGTLKFMHPSVEEITSDDFLTWGWKRKGNYIPAFNLKRSSGKKIKHDSFGGLLLIEVCLGHRIHSWDNTSEFSDYFRSQQDLVKSLPPKVKALLTVRLHGGYRATNWQDDKRWEEFDSAINIDCGNIKISKLYEKNRLVIHSYDSTGMLETLSMNIPTLVFIQNGLNDLVDEAKVHYQLLMEVGIIHDDIDSLLRHLDLVWDNVDEWWFSKIVQLKIREFCEIYSKSVSHPIKMLNEVLVSQ